MTSFKSGSGQDHGGRSPEKNARVKTMLEGIGAANWGAAAAFGSGGNGGIRYREKRKIIHGDYLL